MEKTFRALTGIATLAFLPFLAGAFAGCAGNDPTLTALTNSYGKSYAVVVSQKTYADPAWKEVADTLTRKHAATLIVYSGDIENTRTDLAKKMPRYTAFVATPEECSADYADSVERLTRTLDDDPYLDTLYGIVSGNNAADAGRVAAGSKTINLKQPEAAAVANAGNKETYLRISDTGNTGDIAQSVNSAGDATPTGFASEVLALWQTPPGRNTFAESFFLAAQSTPVTPGTFFCGDPARKALIEPTENSFISGGIVSAGSTHTLTLEIVDGSRAALNKTPVGVIFTQRLKNQKIISGNQYNPILADNFILLLKPQPQNGETEIIVKFEGKPIEE